MSLSFLGIDIAKAKFDAALIVNDSFKNKVFTNNPSGFTALLNWLNKHQVQSVHACMEATNTYGNALATYLFEQHFTVSVVNPAQIKFFAQAQLTRNKNDKLDSQVIARFCQIMKPSAWAPVPKHIGELQALVQRLDALIQMQTQEKNRLHNAQQVVQQSVEDSLAHLASQIAALRQTIKQHIDNHPDLKHKAALLNSIPGIADATIAILLATIGDIARFAHQNQLVAFAGLNPKHRLSGSSLHGKTALSKVGNASLRKALYMPAMVAIRHNLVIKQLAVRLTLKHKPKMLIIGAAMRKLLVIVYGVLKSNLAFDCNLLLAK